MKIRTICTTIFVLVRTTFSHVRIAGAVLFATLLGIYIYSRQKNKKDHTFVMIGISLLFIAITLSFLLRTGSLTLSLFSNKSQQNLSLSHNNIFSTNTKEQSLGSTNTTPPTTFVGTGQIIELQREGRYTLKTVDSTYLLSTKPPLSLGDLIRVTGRFTPTKKITIQHKFIFSSISFPTLFTGGFDYAQWMLMKGVEGDIQSSKVVLLDNTLPLPRILALRKEILNTIQSTFGKTPAGGLLQGMLIGDRSGIPKEKYEQFISSGMVHIVAVSGSNILYVVLFLNIVLFFIPYYIRTGVIIIAIVFYALICGLDSSVVRAVIMGVLALIAILGGRVVSAWRLLSIAWIAMLLRNPLLLLYDLGFLLSFSALVGILIISKAADKLPTKNKISTILKSYILPSIGAGVGTLPVLLFFTGTTNIASIFANIFVVPLVPFVLGWGVVAVLIDSLFSLNSYIDIIDFPFETLYWLARRLTVNGIYLSTELWRTRHLLSAGLVILILLFVRTFHQGRLDSNQD